MADLTYFIGRPFVSLEEREDGEWAIILDGNAQIANKDPEKPLPDEDTLHGMQFLRPIFSELDTRLQFGVTDNVITEIVLTPSLYTITEPSIASEGEVYPQVPQPDTVPPDPSDERVADGPELAPEQQEGEDENDA